MSDDVAKDELLRRLRAGYNSFQQLIASLTSPQLETSGVIGRWSIKDIIVHFIAHEQFALRELTDARKGEVYQSSFATNDDMNAEAVAQYADQSIEQVLQAWKNSFHQIIAAVESLTDAEFAVDGALVSCLNDTVDGALANNTYEHYAEHTPAIEAWMAQR